MTDGLFDDFLPDDEGTAQTTAPAPTEVPGAAPAEGPEGAAASSGGPSGTTAEGNEEEAAPEAAPEEEVHAYVWGTNIQLSAALEQLRTFFATFARPGEAPLYPELCRAAVAAGEGFVNLDCTNLARFSPLLYRQLLSYPSQVIMIMEVALREVYRASCGRGSSMTGEGENGEDEEDEDDDTPLFMVRPFNLAETVPLRELGPDDIDQLVAVCGMVVRTSSVLPNMRAAFFRCTVCGHTEQVDVDTRDRIAEPAVCANCSARASMDIVHNRCTFADKQLVRLQETPESIPEGETPQTVTLYVFDALVDAVKPGDRVEVTGIYRAEPTRASNKTRTVKALYKTCL